MYALLEIRGKQYKVKEGSAILVPGWDEVKPEEINVLMVKDGTTLIGTPTVKDAKVDYETVRQFKGRKINVWRFKSKVNYHRKKSHRIHYTVLKINSIKTPVTTEG
ncbi:50S ribosomal protein L21 [Coprothermobacter platensis]|uniref:50S ribosomal protein L21 n=1 Tax=Coprothermobacter platensis TaxID=108819 RepID=UPI00037F22F2|nr:50S ribosomal protein L21 [Coprothermobacter platensis]